jgi:hypothetical protein
VRRRTNERRLLILSKQHIKGEENGQGKFTMCWDQKLSNRKELH